MKDIAIRVEHVYKQFGGETVLTDINHNFERGKIHGIVGNNGSGKTVLLNVCVDSCFLPRGKYSLIMSG